MGQQSRWFLLEIFHSVANNQQATYLGLNPAKLKYMLIFYVLWVIQSNYSQCIKICTCVIFTRIGSLPNDHGINSPLLSVEVCCVVPAVNLATHGNKKICTKVYVITQILCNWFMYLFAFWAAIWELHLNWLIAIPHWYGHVSHCYVVIW